MAEQKQLAARAANTKPSLALEKYAGAYADSLYGDVGIKANGGKLRLIYGNGIDAPLEHWHYDSFMATGTSVTGGKLMITFALGADGKVKSVEVQGLGTFGRRPDQADSTKKQ